MKATSLVLSLVLAPRLQAETVTLIPVADTAICSQNPDNNYGRFAVLPAGPLNRTSFSGSPPNHVARVLLKFDVAAALPAGAVVTNVSLTVHMSPMATDRTLDKAALHRLLLDWGEGAKSEDDATMAASTGEANWRWCKFGGGTWSYPGSALGSDYLRAESGWVNWGRSGSYTFVSLPAMITDVQGWLSQPEFNFGWLLKSREEMTQEGPGTKGFISREGPENERPRLVIGYTVPPSFEPVLAPPKLVGERLELRYQLAPGSLYELRGFATPSATDFVALTNHTVRLGGFEAIFTEPTNAAQRFYQLVITGQVD